MADVDLYSATRPFVLGVLKVQGETLDGAYLEKWSAELGVADLLRRALEEAGLEGDKV